MGKRLLELVSLAEGRVVYWLFVAHKIQFAVLRNIDEYCDHLAVITAFLYEIVH